MPELSQPGAQPYFIWSTQMTVAQLHEALRSPDPEVRAYWTGTLLREANSRDVWLFVSPQQIRAQWPRLLRHLGRTRSRWAFLLGLPTPIWPPVIDHAE